MNRRTVLSAVVASAGVSIAGCAVPSQSTDDPADLGPAGERGVSVTEYDPDDDVSVHLYDSTWDLEVADDVTAADAVRIGSSDDSHEVVVLAASPIDVTLTVLDSAGEGLYETTAELSPAAYALFRLEAPDAYTIEVVSDSSEGTVAVDPERIDCNRSTQAVVITDDTVDETMESELVDC